MRVPFVFVVVVVSVAAAAECPGPPASRSFLEGGGGLASPKCAALASNSSLLRLAMELERVKRRECEELVAYGAALGRRYFRVFANRMLRDGLPAKELVERHGKCFFKFALESDLDDDDVFERLPVTSSLNFYARRRMQDTLDLYVGLDGDSLPYSREHSRRNVKIFKVLGHLVFPWAKRLLWIDAKLRWGAIDPLAYFDKAFSFTTRGHRREEEGIIGRREARRHRGIENINDDDQGGGDDDDDHQDDDDDQGGGESSSSSLSSPQSRRLRSACTAFVGLPYHNSTYGPSFASMSSPSYELHAGGVATQNGRRAVTDSVDAVATQVEFYRRRASLEVLSLYLVDSAVVARDERSSRCRRINAKLACHWFAHLACFSDRDQLSLPFVLDVLFAGPSEPTNHGRASRVLVDLDDGAPAVHILPPGRPTKHPVVAANRFGKDVHPDAASVGSQNLHWYYSHALALGKCFGCVRRPLPAASPDTSSSSLGLGVRAKEAPSSPSSKRTQSPFIDEPRRRPNRRQQVLDNVHIH